MRVINNIKKARIVVDIIHKSVAGIAFPMTVSIVNMSAWPPSKNGKGKILKRPTFKLSIAKINQ